MTKTILLTAILTIYGIVSYGQSDLQKIQAPSSPAGYVIGIQPATVLSPKSYEALEAAVFSNYYGGSGQVLIPDNLGLEFSPYWAKGRPLTIENYLFPNPAQSLWRNLSVSMASTKNYILRDTVKSNAVGIGLRTCIYFNDQKKQIMGAMNALENSNSYKTYLLLIYDQKIAKNPNIRNLDQALNILIGELKKDDQFLSFLAGNKSTRDLFLESFYKKCRRSLPPYDTADPKKSRAAFKLAMDTITEVAINLSQMEFLLLNRPGFKIDIAGAIALDFPTNDFAFGVVPQQSLWITPTYRFSGKASFLELLGVLRYNWYNLDFYKQYFPGNEAYQHTLDYGASVNLVFKKFTVHGELVGRYSKAIFDQTTDPATGITTTLSKTQTDLQYMGTFSYQVNKKLILSYSLGNQFKPVFSYQGTLISSFGLNFGFGGPTEDDLLRN